MSVHVKSCLAWLSDNNMNSGHAGRNGRERILEERENDDEREFWELVYDKYTSQNILPVKFNSG